MHELNLDLKSRPAFYQGLVKPVLKTDNLYQPFEQSHALLTISVGQEVHEGEKFLATLNLVNQSFARCTICVDDTLQRHTLAMGGELTSEDLFDYSRKLGNQWLVRNFSAYSQLSIPYEIIRWNKWLTHPGYSETYQKIKDLYEKGPSAFAVAEIFDRTSRYFLDRYLPRLGEISLAQREKAEHLSLIYLFEECTALCLWAMEGYDYEVYPSHRSEAMSLIHALLVEPIYQAAVTSVWVKFKNRKQLKPQVLEVLHDGES